MKLENKKKKTKNVMLGPSTKNNLDSLYVP